VFAAAEAAKLVLAPRPDAEMLALWLADAVLAACCGRLPLPLITGALLDPSLRTRNSPIPSWCCCPVPAQRPSSLASARDAPHTARGRPELIFGADPTVV